MKIPFTSIACCLLFSWSSAMKAAEPPAMGWSSYNYFVGSHNDPLFRHMADAFAANGMRDAGYTILRIDGGWWGNDAQQRWYYWTTSGTYQGGFQYQDGDQHVDLANYPQGLKGLADYIHGKSMKLGFYLSPALSLGGSENYPGNTAPQQQPVLQGDALIDRHARVMADAGIDHLFYDGYDWDISKGTEPYERMSASLASEATRVGRRIIFSINSGWKWRANTIADEWRTSRDIDANWSTIMECLNTLAVSAPAGDGRWNNPDYLMAGFPKLSDEESRTQMSLWCVAAAPLYACHDFRAMSAWVRYVLLNTEAISVDQQLTAPGQRLRSANGLDLWARTLSDGSVAVALFNNSSAVADIAVSWPEIGLVAGSARVRDLWTHADAGIATDSYTAKAVPIHGCALMVVKSGTAIIPPLAAKYVQHPGTKPHDVPVSTAGWTMPGGGGFANAAAAFDGNPATEVGDFAYPGTAFEIALPSPRTLTRLLLDQGGVGANPWPLTVYVPGTTFELHASSDNGATWALIASGSLGSTYTPIDFARRSLNRLRFTFVATEKTSAYSSDPHPSIKDIYAFDLDAPVSSKAGDVNGDGVVDGTDLTLIIGQFGRSSTAPGWNEACDLNGDGRIDAVDVGLITRLQGK